MTRSLNNPDAIAHRANAIQALETCLAATPSQMPTLRIAVDEIINAVRAELEPQIHAAATAYQVGIGSNRGDTL